MIIDKNQWLYLYLNTGNAGQALILNCVTIKRAKKTVANSKKKNATPKYLEP